VILQVPERPVGIAHVDATGPVKNHPGRESLADHLETDDEIGDDQRLIPLADARRETPGEKLGVAFDLGHEIEKLLGRIGQKPLLGMSRHGLRAQRARRADRAACRRWKSSSAW
jgi:hypothetical protein